MKADARMPAGITAGRQDYFKAVDRANAQDKQQATFNKMLDELKRIATKPTIEVEEVGI